MYGKYDLLFQYLSYTSRPQTHMAHPTYLAHIGSYMS